MRVSPLLDFITTVRQLPDTVNTLLANRWGEKVLVRFCGEFLPALLPRAVIFR
jgi:hypothetical protein